AGTPSSRAAYATAWPWLPALAAITPAARSASDRDARMLTAPRILNEPVRCRFSAFSRTRRPVRTVSASEPKTAVRRARSPMRSRAARMSASVRVVVVAIGQVEHRPEDVMHGGERVELAVLDAVEQLPQGGIARDDVFQVPTRSRRRDGEHLGR